MRWNRDAKQRRAGRWHGHKAPVGMKYFGKYGRLFVSIALNRANVGETFNVAEKRVFADGAEVLSDPLKVIWTESLIGKRDNLVLEP